MAAKTACIILLIFTLSGSFAFADEDPYSLGVHAFSKGDYQKAKEYFKAADRIKQNNPVIIYNLALTYFYLEEEFPALEQLNIALSIDQEFSRAYYARGVIMLKQGKKDKAEVDFKTACDLGYKNGCTVFNNI